MSRFGPDVSPRTSNVGAGGMTLYIVHKLRNSIADFFLIKKRCVMVTHFIQYIFLKNVSILSREILPYKIRNFFISCVRETQTCAADCQKTTTFYSGAAAQENAGTTCVGLMAPTSFSITSSKTLSPGNSPNPVLNCI